MHGGGSEPVPNQRIEGHRLVGTQHTYRAKYCDPAVHKKPGSLVAEYGHHVEILAVFTNWNDVAGLDMLCPLRGDRP